MDFALFLLIFLAFHNSGQLLSNKICGLKFLEPGVAVLFSTALGSIVFSGIMTVLVFSGFINSAVCWSILVVSLVLGWKNLSHGKKLLRVFWESHDPTQLNRQGNDIGSQYRSAIYCENKDDLKISEDSKSEFQKLLDSFGFEKIQTEITMLKNFYSAFNITFWL